MAQTRELFPRLRHLYKYFVRVPFFNTSVHYFLNTCANIMGRISRFSFPPKFTWEWKLEMLTQRYERDTVLLFKRILKPGMTIIDIGAHIGFYTRIFARAASVDGRVIAFEADPDNFSLLQQNTRRFANVTCIPAAISDHAGTIDFYKVVNSTGCHSIVPTAAAEKITVAAVTLDDYCRDHDIQRVDVIKIDIEGGEPYAFRGMRRLLESQSSLMVVMEFNPSALRAAEQEPRDFLAELAAAGFSIHEIAADGTTKPLTVEETLTLALGRTGYVNILLKK